MLLEEFIPSYESNIKTESLKFGIDPDDEELIIEILRKKLYAFPIRTLVQEYISNARDANLESGISPDKIEIACPIDGFPFFSVRDFGPGLSQERLAKVFVKYGGSTKRHTDSQAGGYGIGAKSAWSYTDAFLVDNYFDGIRSTYLSHIGNAKAGELTLVHSESTDEPNGVRIKVPVEKKDFDAFVRAVTRLVLFWDTSPVMNIDLVPLKPCRTFEGSRVRQYRKKEVPSWAMSKSRVFFDCARVPYPVENIPNANRFVSCYDFRGGAVLMVDANARALGVAATREALTDEVACARRLETAFSAVCDELATELEAQPTWQDTVKLYQELVNADLTSFLPASLTKVPGFKFERGKAVATGPYKFFGLLGPAHHGRSWDVLDGIRPGDLPDAKMLFTLSRMRAKDYLELEGKQAPWRVKGSSDLHIVLGTRLVKHRKVVTLQPLIDAYGLKEFKLPAKVKVVPPPLTDYVTIDGTGLKEPKPDDFVVQDLDWVLVLERAGIKTGFRCVRQRRIISGATGAELFQRVWDEQPQMQDKLAKLNHLRGVASQRGDALMSLRHLMGNQEGLSAFPGVDLEIEIVDMINHISRSFGPDPGWPFTGQHQIDVMIDSCPSIFLAAGGLLQSRSKYISLRLAAVGTVSDHEFLLDFVRKGLK